MKIAYLLPDVNISGGSAVVLRHLSELAKLGHVVSLVVMFGNKNKIKFNKTNIRVVRYEEIKNQELDILVATHWSTVEPVLNSSAKKKIYFVQSDERRFGHETIDKFKECSATYNSQMIYMTEAKWIQRWLKEEFNKDAYYVPNGIDLNIFHPQPKKKSEKKRILIEGNVNLAFKGVMLSMMAASDIPNTEIWLVSSYGAPFEGYKYDKFISSVPLEKMKDIYSSCDIFIKMSRVEGFFGPPLEAMACGCPVVVAKCTGYDEYIKNNYNALVVEEGDYESARKSILKIINDSRLSNRLIKNGISTSKKWSWNNTVNNLLDVINGEPIKTYYNDYDPERYDYKKGVSTALYTIEINQVLHQTKINPLVEELTSIKKELLDNIHKNQKYKFIGFFRRTSRKITKFLIGVD